MVILDLFMGIPNFSQVPSGPLQGKFQILKDAMILLKELALLVIFLEADKQFRIIKTIRRQSPWAKQPLARTRWSGRLGLETKR